jgi:choline dehydrogenase-like flavoprotein
MVEQLPERENRIELDGERRDHFGEPAPRIRLSVSEYERRALRRAREIGLAVLREMGAEPAPVAPEPDFHPVSHHMGGCRMAHDPRHGVVDADGRVHGIENLFVVGSSVFVTGGAVPPTLTIAALALRAAEQILGELRRGQGS